MTDSADAAFWEERYQAETMPWDFHGVPADVTHFLKATKPDGRVLIPGCGSAYEVAAFLEAGWDAWGIDFSETAVKRAQKILGKEKGHILCGDFFTHRFELPFDVIYERRFLCALPPHLRDAYASRMNDILIPEGRLVGFFFYGESIDIDGKAMEGPPFPLQDVKEARKLFSHFELIEDLPVNAIENSIAVGEGKERWQEWRKILNQHPPLQKKSIIRSSRRRISF